MTGIRIGCAGWNIPKDYAERFPAAGTHLARYSAVLPAVEINTSFYKPHQPATYARWAASVPESFRFSVKIPKEVTHTRRLVDVDNLLDRFLSEVTGLGENLGPLLIQFPPSFRFSAATVDAFLQMLRSKFGGNIVVEPRHPSWFDTSVDQLLARFRVARVAADPAAAERAGEPGGWDGIIYFRLHGSPDVYYSTYSQDYLDTLVHKLTIASRAAEVWCVFDNTATGAATANALDLLDRVAPQVPV